jgi:indole-3-glycerol phosphate synthase
MTSGPAAPPDLLAAILAATLRRVASDAARAPLAALERRVADAPPTRGFATALTRANRQGLQPPAFAVIAECKRRSPSRGVLRRAYDPAAIAASYEAHGAAAISVLTEPGFFDGSLDHLRAVRRAVSIPVLRKEFIVDRYQLVEARAAGADAILLIVAALDDERLRRLLGEARALGLDALVEVHDDAELDRALAAGATIVGVNNRNLRTLAVDLDASRRLAACMPSQVVGVAESGIRTHADLTALQALGYCAFLVGERLMTAPDPGEALADLTRSAEGRR